MCEYSTSCPYSFWRNTTIHTVVVLLHHTRTVTLNLLVYVFPPCISLLLLSLSSFLTSLHSLDAKANRPTGYSRCLPVHSAQCEAPWSHQLLLLLGQNHAVCFCAGKSAVSELLHPSGHHGKQYSAVAWRYM